MNGTCSTCGKPLGSKYASRCGTCRKGETARARAANYVYTRVHVHIAADGTRSIREGVECGCVESEGAA